VRLSGWKGRKAARVIVNVCGGGWDWRESFGGAGCVRGADEVDEIFA
jgi:hypothetical protein